NATLRPTVARSKASDGLWSRLVRRGERQPSRPQIESFRAATVQESLDIEVVRFSFGVRDPEIQPPFQFLMASDGVKKSLGHGSSTPETKLAGMKLNHFGGFLKRSWRANDWLWGRLDGVEHLLNSLIDADRLIELGASVAKPLSQLAFALDPGAAETPAARRELERVWAGEVTGVTFPHGVTSP